MTRFLAAESVPTNGWLHPTEGRIDTWSPRANTECRKPGFARLAAGERVLIRGETWGVAEIVRRMFRARMGGTALRPVAFQQTDEPMAVELGNTVTARPLSAPSAEPRLQRALRPLPELEPTPPPGRRHRSSRSTQRRAAVLRATLDLATLIVAAVAAVAFDSGSPLTLTALVTFVVVTLGILHATSIHAVRDRLRLEVLDDARLIVSATAVAAMASQFVAALALGNEPSAYDAMRLWGFSAALLVVTHAASIAIVHRRRRTELGGMRTLIVGAGQVGRLTAGRLVGAPELGLHPVGFLDKEPIDRRPPRCRSPCWVRAGTSSMSSRHTASTASCSRSRPRRTTSSSGCWTSATGSACAPSSSHGSSSASPRASADAPRRSAAPRADAHEHEELPVRPEVRAGPRRRALLVLLLSPILIAVALAVLLSLGRPILYRQKRVGRDGRHFEMLKFRTMRPDHGGGAERGRVRPRDGAGRRRGVRPPHRRRVVPPHAPHSTSCRSSSTSSRAR